jgi:glycosyltransferase involved in cell wall biosynthesis
MPFHELVAAEQRALVFLHTMRNEHFGISLVEAMAAGERALPPNFTRDFGSDFVGAGAVVIAHKSGGPRDDICLEQVTAAASAFSRAF